MIIFLFLLDYFDESVLDFSRNSDVTDNMTSYYYGGNNLDPPLIDDGTVNRIVKKRKIGDRGTAISVSSKVDNTLERSYFDKSDSMIINPPHYPSGPYSDLYVYPMSHFLGPPSLSDPVNSNNEFSLIIGQQPPSSIVYKRILKPFPAVMLKEKSLFSLTQKLFVDVSLIKNNDITQILPYLEGGSPKSITNNNYAVFDKLKINSTSKSNKCQYRLYFQLKEFNGVNYSPLPGAYAVSNPIEVFSHSSYMKEEKISSKLPPPIISEILPNVGNAGDKCVILGANFVKSDKLKVRFGDNIFIKPEYHESVTLVVRIPQITGLKEVPVYVTNDGKEYCNNSNISFVYL